MSENFEKVLQHFKTLTTIPRGSENREGIKNYLCDFANKHRLRYRTDAADNVVIFKPAAAEYADRSPVILQGHTDMVCALEEGYTFDFLSQALHLKQEGDFLTAEGTSLGGDDGAAVAMMLALLESDVPLPALECIFTADEEIGMIGANALDMSDITGKYLINIDSEDEGVLTVSCAGGSTAVVNIPYTTEAVSGYVYEITLGGLTGGHSGTEIVKGGFNANKLLGEVLKRVKDYAIVSLHGGEKENAIAVSASVTLAMPREFDFTPVLEEVKGLCRSKEPDFYYTCRLRDNGKVQAMDARSTAAVAGALIDLPQGIIQMSAFDAAAVQTSLNLGILEQTPTEVIFTFCVRSSVQKEREALETEIQTIAATYGGTVVLSGIYPSWEYKKESLLREKAVEVYETMFGDTPELASIHAGLECGVILSKKPEIECISLGPQMYDVHTARERLSISSFERTWQYLQALIRAL